MKRILTKLTLVFAAILSVATLHASDKVALLVILGQSNADGSAFSEPELDLEMQQWYTTSPLARNLHIWYVPTQVKNEENKLGQIARHVIDGRYRDMPPQWMQLWYRNDNTARRTAMNMIHGAGSYSDVAQGRRGIEGQFGRRFADAYPDKELFVVKLGASGSGIDTWANPADDNNWRYFIEQTYKPAIESLKAMGKDPELIGVWWMQGCADSEMSADDYAAKLKLLAERLNGELGFDHAPLYIGTIPKPAENMEVNPNGSVGFGQGVRTAQERVAATTPNVKLVNTSDCPMQFEDQFKGKIHFNHAGVNRIADHLADSIAAAGTDAWGQPTSHSAWQLEWEENFDGNQIDWNIWSKIPRGKANWNDCMSDADTLYAVADGKLILRGMRTSAQLPDTAACVTGGVFTKGKKAFGHGRLEIEAKLQPAQGAWPAIWLLPAPVDGKDVGWPNGGEIDIMERLNFDNFAYQTVHSPYTLDQNITDKPRSSATGRIAPDGYNVYAVELYSDSISFFINGVHTLTYRRNPALGPQQFPFDREFYLLIDMQLGGSWVGPVNPDQLPVEMLVERVSFYRRR